jgi:hypothetical protein
LPELLEQRHRYQAERARAEELARVNQQLLEALQRQQPQQQPQPIDPVAEPERYYAELQRAVDQRLQAAEQTRQQEMQHVQQQMLSYRADVSEQHARRAHGNEAVDTALQAAHAAGVAQAFVQQSDPYGALIDWHRQQQVVREVGSDLAGFRAKVEQQVREKVMAELRQGRQPSSLPPSIAAAPNGAAAPQSAVPTRDFFNSMMAPGRKR